MTLVHGYAELAYLYEEAEYVRSAVAHHRFYHTYLGIFSSQLPELI
jgi:hypothetical protein